MREYVYGTSDPKLLAALLRYLGHLWADCVFTTAINPSNGSTEIFAAHSMIDLIIYVARAYAAGWRENLQALATQTLAEGNDND